MCARIQGSSCVLIRLWWGSFSGSVWITEPSSVDKHTLMLTALNLTKWVCVRHTVFLPSIFIVTNAIRLHNESALVRTTKSGGRLLPSVAKLLILFWFGYRILSYEQKFKLKMFSWHIFWFVHQIVCATTVLSSTDSNRCGFEVNRDYVYVLDLAQLYSYWYS